MMLTRVASSYKGCIKGVHQGCNTMLTRVASSYVGTCRGPAPQYMSSLAGYSYRKSRGWHMLPSLTTMKSCPAICAATAAMASSRFRALAFFKPAVTAVRVAVMTSWASWISSGEAGEAGEAGEERDAGEGGDKPRVDAALASCCVASAGFAATSPCCVASAWPHSLAHREVAASKFSTAVSHFGASRRVQCELRCQVSV